LISTPHSCQIQILPSSMLRSWISAKLPNDSDDGI